LHQDLKRSLHLRIEKTKELVNNSKDQWIVWTLGNIEADLLRKELIDSRNVQGSDISEIKAKNLLAFAKNEFKTLITKTKIAAMGMNFQNCNNMIFTSYDFKFEQFYQAVRRCYRFGQKSKVYVHLLVPQSQLNVRKIILEKQKKHFEMIKQMSNYSANTNYKMYSSNDECDFEEVKNDKYWLMLGDSIKLSKKVEKESVDYIFFSPPFKDLYTYSNDPSDLSNVGGDKEFYEHFTFLVPELFRTLKQGRLLSMHIMQGTTSIGKDGYLSIVDFRGELIRLFQKHGFIFHAEKMIRKNPQLAAVRTKNQQLMHGTTKRDSSISRCGLADYIITFRKPGKNQVPIKNEIEFEKWCVMAEPYEFDNDINIEVLRKINEPLWLDIDEGNVISNFRSGKGSRDEKHMTPTQLDVMRNCFLLWSNEGDTIFDPFGGVGSTGFKAIEMKRKSISIELKESYFRINQKNHRDKVKEMNSVLTLF
jgi:DNA modification methylase